MDGYGGLLYRYHAFHRIRKLSAAQRKICHGQGHGLRGAQL